MNILSYVVTFPATTARKTFFGTPTGPTQASLFRYVNSRSMFKLELNMNKFYNLWPRFLVTQFTGLRPGAECVNILSYAVTFPATTARKTFFGTPTGPTQASLFRYVNSRSMFKLELKKTIS